MIEITLCGQPAVINDIANKIRAILGPDKTRLSGDGPDRLTIIFTPEEPQ